MDPAAYHTCFVCNQVLFLTEDAFQAHVHECLDTAFSAQLQAIDGGAPAAAAAVPAADYAFLDWLPAAQSSGGSANSLGLLPPPPSMPPPPPPPQQQQQDFDRTHKLGATVLDQMREHARLQADVDLTPYQRRRRRYASLRPAQRWWQQQQQQQQQQHKKRLQQPAAAAADAAEDDDEATEAARRQRAAMLVAERAASGALACVSDDVLASDVLPRLSVQSLGRAASTCRRLARLCADACVWQAAGVHGEWLLATHGGDAATAAAEALATQAAADAVEADYMAHGGVRAERRAAPQSHAVVDVYRRRYQEHRAAVRAARWREAQRADERNRERAETGVRRLFLMCCGRFGEWLLLAATVTTSILAALHGDGNLGAGSTWLGVLLPLTALVVVQCACAPPLAHSLHIFSAAAFERNQAALSPAGASRACAPILYYHGVVVPMLEPRAQMARPLVCALLPTLAALAAVTLWAVTSGGAPAAVWLDVALASLLTIGLAQLPLSGCCGARLTRRVCDVGHYVERLLSPLLGALLLVQWTFLGLRVTGVTDGWSWFVVLAPLFAAHALLFCFPLLIALVACCGARCDDCCCCACCESASDWCEAHSSWAEEFDDAPAAGCAVGLMINLALVPLLITECLVAARLDRVDHFSFGEMFVPLFVLEGLLCCVCTACSIATCVDESLLDDLSDDD